MSNSMNSQMHIFLVQPLRKNQYKEMIVYADTEQQARKAAALAYNPEKNPVPSNSIPAETVYLDRGMSICITIEPNLIKIGDDPESVRVKYNEVMYDLRKSVAQEVIAENVL